MFLQLKLFEMSSIGSFPSATESLQRLEDFSAYSSCIRCFGKSIISPLLTAEQREEACRFRTAAAKIIADNVKKKEESTSLSDKVKAVYRSVEEHLSACNNKDFVSYIELGKQEDSALHETRVIDVQTSPTDDATIFSSEMHISTCKIPSSDICSTVHKDVIVSPNIIQTNNDKGDLSMSDTKCLSSYPDKGEAHVALDNAECLTCQDSNQQDLPVWDSESAPTEEMYSVSEDEHDSITESTEFGSLPTVINAGHFVPQDTDNDSNATCFAQCPEFDHTGQFVPQDTDNESNVTCLTQSTDLEKYLDSSIEYSSPEDGQSQVSNRLNMSRSEDASSETLVNTGSESTPCASAMAMLSYGDSNVVGVKALPASLANDSVVPLRARSVDSYMKTAEARTEKLPIRKSKSDPAYSESKQYLDVNLSLNPPDMIVEDSKMKDGIEDCEQFCTPVSDSELSFELKTETKKSLKRKHVRTNSYTLEHPSPALIMAHADCNCSEKLPNLSPHSCSSENIILSPPNLAFKKEKVNIVLPPKQERDKYFPILSSANILMNKIDTNQVGDSKLSMSNVVQLSETAFVNSPVNEITSRLVENSNINMKPVQNTAENSSRQLFEESSEMNNYARTQEINQQNEQVIMSNAQPSETQNNDIELLNQVIRDVKEIQKNRVNQFFEEQNKLWLQMQEEFKEQERMLCQKLNAVDILSLSDDALPMPYEFTDGDIKQSSVIEKNIPEFNNNAVTNLNINRNSNTEDHCLSVAEHLEGGLSEKSHSTKLTSDALSPSNFKATEFPNENIHCSLSTALFVSTANTREESESAPPLPERSSSLSASNGSLHTDSFDGHRAGSHSLQSNVSSKSFNSSDGRFQNHTLSDRPESIHSSVLVRSDTNDNFKAPEISVGSSIHRGINPMQSLYNNCPISVLREPNCLESDSSFVSFRSSSDLSQASGMNKVFCDSRFLKENVCRECSAASPGSVCVDQEHGESGSVCSECYSCSKCYSLERLQIAYENLSDDGSRLFTTPISPAEFIPHPSLFNKEKRSTSTTINLLPSPTPDVTATTLSLRNNNSSPLELNSSATANSDAAEQYPLSNNNLKPNTLIISAKNNLSNVNIQGDKSYSEDEIRAINDLVQSSYTSSYACQLNEDYGSALVPCNNSNKHLSCQSSCNIPSVKKGALKQSISTSLTNLKRRKSRDIIKDPILLKKFETLPALVKGYLTRRLFKTERVQDVIRTLKDTALLVGNFSQELGLKGDSVSENEVDLHRQLISQLLKTYECLYDIFCTISIKEQMKIISESRNFLMKKRASDKKESSTAVIAEKCRSSPSKRPKLSSATIKALERKRSSINSRTYTVEDFKGCRPRVHSTTFTKSRTISPSRIYKSSVGTSMKRKTTSVCKNSPWK